MFKLSQSDFFWYPVNVEHVAESGKRVTQQFEARFKRLGTDAYKSVIERTRDGALTDHDLMRDMLAGWRGIQGEDGAEMEFTDDNREMLFGVWPVLPSLVMAWFEAHNPKASRKN